jgi:hypothetical protein
MGNLLKLILNGDLELKDLLSVVGVFDLLDHLGSILVHGSLKQALSVVELVAVHIREELGELIVAVGCVSIVLNLEVRKTQK